MSCPATVDCPTGASCLCDADGRLSVEERDSNGDGEIDARWFYSYDAEGNLVSTDPWFSEAVMPRKRRIARIEAWDFIRGWYLRGAPAPILGGPDLPPLSPLQERTVQLPLFDGWTVVPLAQLQRGDRTVVVVWPAIDPGGAVIDDDIVGVLWQRVDGAEPRLLSRNWPATARGAIESQLGGPVELVLDRREGVPLDELGDRMAGLPEAFGRAVAAGDRNEAVAAARQFARLFDLETVVRHDTVAEILLRTTQGRRFVVVATSSEGARATLRLWGPDYFNEWVVEDEIEAAPIDGDHSRWITPRD